MAAVGALLNRALAKAAWLPPSGRRGVDLATATRGERLFVCESEDGSLEGFISVYEQDSFIHHLYVEPGREGLGTGTRLLDCLHTVLPLPWRLKCVMANTQALEFYRKRGWGEETQGISDDGPYVVMVKPAPDTFQA